MSYEALYRKFRPKVFDDVIGQDHITTTLTNQVKSGKISHAYLFTGSRGTGKTTCAKIFARAVNCISPINGSPCGKCEICEALSKENSIDVLEIDAASNNKVDEIRELREKVQYPPVKGKYKVYIIDEVHMLTDSAFNALLKTLEEPPEYVIFILATTEVHKLPATILSRCLRFDFRLVSNGELTEQIKKVYNQVGKKYEEEAVRYIAEAGEGSVRDSLSIADMCLNYSSGELKYGEVLFVLGATDKTKITELFNCLVNSDVGGCLKSINNLASSGKSMSLIAKELTKYARNLLVLKTTDETLVIDTKENIGKMKLAAENLSADLLVSIIRIFSSVDSELRYSVSPKIVLETAAIRACRLFDIDITALSERVRRLEEGGVKMPVGNIVLANNAEQKSADTEQNIESDKTIKPMDAKSVWGRLTTYFRTNKMMAMYALLGNKVDYKIEDDKLIVSANNELFLQFSETSVIEEINQALKAENLTLKVTKIVGEVDMDKEIDRVKKLIGNAKLNIIKK